MVNKASDFIGTSFVIDAFLSKTQKQVVFLLALFSGSKKTTYFSGKDHLLFSSLKCFDSFDFSFIMSELNVNILIDFAKKKGDHKSPFFE